MSEEQGQNCKPCTGGRVRDELGRCVMPDVTFTSLVLSLNTTALFHLGELAHPEGGEKSVDLELVKHTVDTLVILHDKTKGNLDSDESQLIEKVIYDLKMRFVRAKDKTSARQ